MYATAVVFTAIAFALRAGMDPALKGEMHFTLFWVAAAAAMWRHGAAAALLSSVLGYVGADFYFIEPVHSLTIFSREQLPITLVYFVITFFTCYMMHIIVTADERSRRLIEELADRKAELESENQERSRAINALQKTERLLREVLRALPVGVWIMDETGRISETNPVGLQVWGGARMVKPDQFHEYKAWYTKTGKRIQANEWAAARAFAHGDTTINEELEIEAFDGTRKIILNSAIPIWEGGKVVGAIIVNQDISERKRNEDELRRAKESQEEHSKVLEEQVTERTAHLHETIHSLEGVLYHIAHNLRAPLRAMEGFSSLLLQNYGSKLDELGRSYLGRIAEGAVRMDGLIQDLLTYGRVAREELGGDRIQLKLLLEECLDQLRPEIAAKNAIIRMRDPLPEVSSNRSLLLKIFCALLSNAIRFSRPGVPPEVEVYSKRMDGAWRICVQDNGIGISHEYQPKVFQIFEKLTQDADSSGSGMGLAIAQKAAQRLGGGIGVNSEPGEGSCFWVDLPDAPKLLSAPPSRVTL